MDKLKKQAVIRIVISVACAVVFMISYVMVAQTISHFFPNTFLTREIRLERAMLPPLILVPVLGPMMLLVWLKLDFHGDFSTTAFVLRVIISFGPVILFYSIIPYLVLGRLKWFGKKTDKGTLPEPPAPPEF